MGDMRLTEWMQAPPATPTASSTATAAGLATFQPTSTVQHRRPRSTRCQAAKPSLMDKGRSNAAEGQPQMVGIHVGVAISNGLAPCLHCFPNFKGRA